HKPAVLGLGRKRRPQRQAALLAGHVLGVAARLGAEDDATPGVLGRPDRALASATGALLPVGFAPTAADLGAGLGIGAALAVIGQLADQSLVQEPDVDVGAEQMRVEGDL